MGYCGDVHLYPLLTGSEGRVLQAVIARFAACQRDPALLVPGGRVLTAPEGWCATHPLPLAQLNTARPDAPTEAFLDAVSAAHAAVWSRWSLPEEQLNLRPALAARGYREGAPVELLLAEADRLVVPPSPPDEVAIRAAVTGEDAWRWAVASHRLRGAVGAAPSEDLLWDALVSPGVSHRLFLAEIPGEIVGAAAVQVCAGHELAFLWGAVTAPGWRGRGVHRRLLAARLNLAKAEKLGLILTLAGPTGAGPTLRRLGFEGTGRWTVAMERPPLRSRDERRQH